MEQQNFDSIGLTNIFSSLSNSNTGIGTTRDKSKTLSIGRIPRLTNRALNQLYSSSGLLQRLVNCYPQECRRDWMLIRQVRLENQAEQPIEELFHYLEKLKFKDGRMGVKEAFTTASILARKLGDAFILIGVADGRSVDQPVDINNIQSIEWLKVLSRSQLTPQWLQLNYLHPEFYNVLGSDVDRKWHHTRVLRFSGHKLYDLALTETGGYNDSVIQSIFNVWSAWQMGLMSGSAMLADYDQGVYKFKGLGQALSQDVRNKNNDRQTQIQRRLYSAEMGRSVLKALLLDMDEEDFNYVSRSYTGAGDIMNFLKDALISEVDIPEYKLFNKAGAGSLSSQQTAGLAQRYDWATNRNNWMADNWIEPYERLLRLTMYAKDSPISNEVEFQVIPNAQVELTPLEKLEAQNEAARRDQINIELGVYSAFTAQNQYKNSDWSGNVTLAQEDLL